MSRHFFFLLFNFSLYFNGVAVIVEASTDNRNRTAADVRHAFDKCGGNLGTTGCVSYLFERKGVIVIDKTTTDNLTFCDNIF